MHGVAGPHLMSAAADAASRPRTSSSTLGGCMVAAAGSDRSAQRSSAYSLDDGALGKVS